MAQRVRVFENDYLDRICHFRSLVLCLPVIVAITASHPCFCQTPSILDLSQPLGGTVKAFSRADFSAPATGASETRTIFDDPGDPAQPERPGLVHRSVTRYLQDQKKLYSAPFQRSNFKWDLLVLAGTGALIATDRHIERHLPGGNVDIYGNVSNVAIGGTASALAILWGYGLKTHNEHLKEMGSLEMEALVNTFLIYTPMQVIAGRQRPGEGNGYGDFWRHHNIDTSFPAGHPMFTITMASVVAHEYPKPWVKALAYGAAGAVMGGRLLGRDHWTSDVFVGSTLGYFIGAHIFHLHCNPAFSEACHDH